MTIRKKQRRELRKLRLTYAERPLRFDGRIVRRVEVPSRAGWLGRVLLPLVALVPTYRPTRSGRSIEKQVRGAILVVGLIIAVWGGTMLTALLGCVLAMLGQVIPVAEPTRVRWRQRCEALQRPGQRIETAPAAVAYDGRRVVVTQGDRQVRALDTHEGHSVRLRRAGEHLALGLVPKKDARTEAIWLRCPLSTVPANTVDIGAIARVDAATFPTTVEVAWLDLALLHDALCGDEEPLGSY